MGALYYTRSATPLQGQRTDNDLRSITISGYRGRPAEEKYHSGSTRSDYSAS